MRAVGVLPAIGPIAQAACSHESKKTLTQNTHATSPRLELVIYHSLADRSSSSHSPVSFAPFPF